MIKRITYFFLIIFGTQLIAADINFTFVTLLDENSEHCIYANKVNIRENPNLKSKILGVGVIGDRVKIIKNTDIKEKIYGLESFWYKVKCNNVIGYIWGGLISSLELHYDFDNNGTSELLMSRCLSNSVRVHVGEYLGEYIHTAKLITADKKIIDNPFNEELLKSSFFKIITIKQFEPKITLLDVNFTFGDAGMFADSHQLFYLKNNKFKSITYYQSKGSPSQEEITKISFNNNRIILKSEEIKYKIDENSLERDAILNKKFLYHKEYKWDGNTFRRTR